MILKLFAIYDNKAKAYLIPFFLPENALAIRTFGDCINDETHAFSKHPEDYTLFTLGEYSNDSASFKLDDAPQPLHNGLELIQQPIGQQHEINNDQSIQSST